MGVEITPASLILLNVFVDRLVTDADTALTSQLSRDLIGTEILPQKLFHYIPDTPIKTRAPASSALARRVVRMRVLSPITPVGTAAVTLEFAADRGGCPS